MIKRTLTLVALCAVLLAAAACGSSSGSSSSDPTGTSTGSGSSGGSSGPIVVEHRYGTTTIDERPQRIVSLDTQWTDVLSVLDAPLVGAALDPTIEGGKYPWQDLPDSVERIGGTEQLPYEQVAALNPDLIVVSYFLTSAEEYELLSQIAPTIPLLGDAQVNQWQDVAAVAGEIVGDPAAAEAMVVEAEQRSASVLEELPGLAGQSYLLVNYVPGDALYVVADPTDGAATLFAQLGMEIEPELLAMAQSQGVSGRVKLSLENVGMLDSDVLLVLTNGAELTSIPGFAELPAAGRGTAMEMDMASVVGLNTPTPLSIPYSLEVIRPVLEKAAAGS